MIKQGGKSIRHYDLNFRLQSNAALFYMKDGKNSRMSLEDFDGASLLASVDQLTC